MQRKRNYLNKDQEVERTKLAEANFKNDILGMEYRDLRAKFFELQKETERLRKEVKRLTKENEYLRNVHVERGKRMSATAYENEELKARLAKYERPGEN